MGECVGVWGGGSELTEDSDSETSVRGYKNEESELSEDK